MKYKRPNHAKLSSDSSVRDAYSSPGEDSCGSEVHMRFLHSQTDLVEGTFHHSAGTQNLRLGPCCLYVLQVLLSDLQAKTFQVIKEQLTRSTTGTLDGYRLVKKEKMCDTLFLISRTSFGLVFIGMNWLATAAWRTPSSFVHCKHHIKC